MITTRCHCAISLCKTTCPLQTRAQDVPFSGSSDALSSWGSQQNTWRCVWVALYACYPTETSLTALTEKTEVKIIHHWDYASRFSSSTTESSSGHYSVRSLQYFSISSSWAVLSLSYHLPVSLGRVRKTCIQGFWIGTQTSKSFVMHLNIIKTNPPIDDTLYCVITNCHLNNIASCCFLCDVIS